MLESCSNVRCFQGYFAVLILVARRHHLKVLFFTIDLYYAAIANSIFAECVHVVFNTKHKTVENDSVAICWGRNVF